MILLFLLFQVPSSLILFFPIVSSPMFVDTLVSIVSSPKFIPSQHGFSKSSCKTVIMLLHVFEFITLPVYFQRQVYNIILIPATLVPSLFTHRCSANFVTYDYLLVIFTVLLLFMFTYCAVSVIGQLAVDAAR